MLLVIIRRMFHKVMYCCVCTCRGAADMDDDDLEGFLAGGLNMQVGDKWGQSGTYITVMFILCGEEGSFYLPPGGACRIGRLGGGHDFGIYFIGQSSVLYVCA